MKRINLGCGTQPIAGWINVDRVPLDGVDVVWNLDDGPWPWDDRSITEIRAEDVFEHVDNPLLFVNECGRVLKTGGVLQLQTCYWRNEAAFCDPTHKRFPTEKSLDYWCRGTEYNIRYGPAYAAPGVLFEKVSAGVQPNTQLLFVLRRIDAQ